MPYSLKGKPMAESDKITKDQAGYDARGSADPLVRCGTCRMFEPPVACSLVQGNINASAICAHWEKRK